MQNNRREIPVPQAEASAVKDSGVKQEVAAEEKAGQCSDAGGESLDGQAVAGTGDKEEEDAGGEKNEGDEEGDDGGNWKRRKITVKREEDEEEMREGDFPPESDLIPDFADGHEEE